MRRREFIGFAGAAIAAPQLARAEQKTLPVIGFVHLTSPEATRELRLEFLRGLGEAGFIEGSNVTIEYRWARGENDRLPALIAELVQRQVSVIVILESTHG